MSATCMKQRVLVRGQVVDFWMMVCRKESGAS